MFAAQRQTLLAHMKWKPEHSGLYFVETTDEEPAQLRYGALVDAEIREWVQQNVRLCFQTSHPRELMQ